MNFLLTVFFAVSCLIAGQRFYQPKMKSTRAISDGTHPLFPNSEKLLVCLIFALGIFVRFAAFWSIPGGLNQDEASAAYDAFADLFYGQDRNGYHNPVYSVAWGSGHSSLYLTLSKPWIALFGLNVFTARITNVLFGSLSLFAFWGAAKRLVPDHHTTALFLFAICPWHIMASRWGLDCNLFPSVFLWGLYFLTKGVENSKFYPLAAFFCGISLYAYGASYLTVPVFLLLCCLYLLRRGKLSFKMAAVSAAVFLVVAAPIALFMVIQIFDLPPLDWGFMSFPKLISGRYHSTITVLSGNLFDTMWTNLKRLLAVIFFQNDGLIWNAIDGFGTMYLFSAPFFLLGFASLFIRKKGEEKAEKAYSPQWIILFLLIAAFVLGITTEVNINRANFVFIPLLFLMVRGMGFVFTYLKKMTLPTLGIYACAFLLFAGSYVTSYRTAIGKAFFQGAGEAICYASQQSKGTVYLSNEINAPYVLALFYTQKDPQTFIDTVDYLNPDSECRVVLSFDRYVTGVRGTLSENESAVISEGERHYFDDGQYQLTPFENYYVVTKK